MMTLRVQRLGAGFAIAPIAIGVGALTVADQRLAVGCVAALLLVGAIQSGAFRLSLVVLGGLVVLQSSAGLSASKAAYLGAAGLAVLVAAEANRRDESSDALGIRPPLRRIGIGMFLVVLVGLVAAKMSGTPISEAARDAAPYLLLASTPLLAVDAANHIRRAPLELLFAVAGSMAAASFAITWLERRHLASLPFNRLFFPSFSLAVAFFCFTFARAYVEDKTSIWFLFLSGVVLALLLVTATRSALVLFIAPLVMAVADWNGPRNLVRLGLLAVALALLAVGLTRVAATTLHVDASRITSRLSSVSLVGSDPTATQSLTERTIQTRLAWKSFTAAPVVGMGLGHHLVWRDQFGTVHDAFTADTGLVYLAKFGIVGVLVLVFVLSSFRVVLQRIRARARPADYAALLGFLGWAIGSLPLGAPFEDKGFAFGLIFLIALAMSHESSAAV
jgi:hypothetical protein